MTDHPDKPGTWVCPDPDCGLPYTGGARWRRSTRRAHERRHERGLPVAAQHEPGWAPDKELAIPAPPKASLRRR